jgi:hypothetical protein
MKSWVTLVWTVGLTAALAGLAQAQIPQIGYIFPTGGQRGQTITVTVNGQNLQGTTHVLFSGAGVAAKVAPTADGKGLQNTNAGALPIVVSIAPDAPLGVREMRVFGPRGVSNVGRFSVGAHPEVNESEPNNTLPQAQKINTPVTINGQINGAEDEDLFAFEAKEGQQMVFAVESFPLTFALDSVLTLRDAQGRPLATGRDPLRFDASLTYSFKRSGTYVLQIHDWTYSGGAHFVYRLTIGAVPFITSIFPAGGQKGTSVVVTLSGVNLPTTTHTVNVPADAASPMMISVGGSNSVPFYVGEFPEGVEQEPNDSRETATRFASLPLTINGRIEKPGEKDYFTFPAQAGQRFIFEVFGRRIGSPLDSLLTLTNAQGNEVVAPADDIQGSLDSRLDFTFPATGDYVLMIRDATHRGGEDFVYRIVIAPPGVPDFTLTASPDALNVGQGGNAVITINGNRLNGFNGDIALSVPNPPPGITVTPNVLRAGQNVTLMSLTAAPNAPVNFTALDIVGTATIGDKTVTRHATPMETFTRRADGNPGQRPVNMRVLSIAEQPPFTVATPATQLVLAQGQAVQLPVTVVRKAGFNGAINLTLSAQPPLNNINAPQVAIGGDKNEGVFTIKAEGNAAAQTYAAFINANANNVNQTSAVFTLTVIPPPITLAVNPNNPTIEQGGTAQVKVTITRHNNFAGEITLKFVNLPKGITAGEVKLAGNQNEVTLALTAAADAAVGNTQNVLLTATATVNGQTVTLNGPAVTLVVNAKK